MANYSLRATVSSGLDYESSSEYQTQKIDSSKASHCDEV